MAGSRLVAVRSAVIAGLLADVKASVDTDDADVNFVYQWKLDASVREWVFTGDARFTHKPAAMSAAPIKRDEVGRFNLIVLVAGPDLSQEEASDRCMDIVAACEAWIAARPSNQLGVTGLQTLTVDGDGFLDEQYLETGHLAIVELPIKYTARLT